MDPVINPYAPGAGTPPPELAGRDALRENIRIAVKRMRIGNAAKSLILVGLRGVGKTVLLDQMRKDVEALGALTLRIEAPEDRSLPALLAPQLRTTLLGLSKVDAARDLARKSLRALAGFAKALKLKYGDIEVGVDLEAEAGLADNGDLETDLSVLLQQVGLAAKSANTILVMFIDELQYVQEDELSALISAMHRCAQEKLPLTLVAAGLPQLVGRAGKAKSYAERLFDYPEIGPLSNSEASIALTRPAADLDVRFQDTAVDEIFRCTFGYPYFLQEWGKHVWDLAPSSPITKADVERASDVALAALDENFFRVRFDRCTPAERRYLRAMAELGPGPHRSGDIAQTLSQKVITLAPLRNRLIRKGMIWAPSHGDTAFTVPLFHDYLARVMPGDAWKSLN
jgi:hypothetical protein